MPTDLSSLFSDDRKVKFDTLKVLHKESGEVRLIKSTRFNPQFHSMNIPSGAPEKLDFNHPSGPIELKVEPSAAPIEVPSEKKVSTDVSDTPVEISPDLGVSMPSYLDTNPLPITVEAFPCSKGCGKMCASNTGRAAHERACKFITQ